MTSKTFKTVSYMSYNCTVLLVRMLIHTGHVFDIKITSTTMYNLLYIEMELNN